MAAMLPVMPIAVRVAPGIGCGVRFIARIACRTCSTCCDVAWVSMTTSMVVFLERSEGRRKSLSQIEIFNDQLAPGFHRSRSGIGLAIALHHRMGRRTP